MHQIAFVHIFSTNRDHNCKCAQLLMHVVFENICGLHEFFFSCFPILTISTFVFVLFLSFSRTILASRIYKYLAPTTIFLKNLKRLSRRCMLLFSFSLVISMPEKFILLYSNKFVHPFLNYFTVLCIYFVAGCLYEICQVKQKPTLGR